MKFSCGRGRGEREDGMNNQNGSRRPRIELLFVSGFTFNMLSWVATANMRRPQGQYGLIKLEAPQWRKIGLEVVTKIMVDRQKDGKVC